MEQYLVMLVGALFGLLVMVLAWIGSRVHQRLDGLTTMLSEKLEQMNAKLGGIEKDLRNELSHLDRRVTRVESDHGRCEK